MSVLVKGMEMPKSCAECDIKVRCFTNVKNIEWLTYHPAFYEERLTDCPLVEVPTPHGRLIDADAMAEDLNFDVECDQRALDQMDFVGQERENIQFDKDCKQNYLLYLSNASTIIESEYLNEQTN